MGYLLGILSSHLIKLHKKVLGHCQEICLQLACEQDLWSRMGKRESRRREREEGKRGEGRFSKSQPHLPHSLQSQPVPSPPSLPRWRSQGSSRVPPHEGMRVTSLKSVYVGGYYRSFQPPSDPSSPLQTLPAKACSQTISTIDISLSPVFFQVHLLVYEETNKKLIKKALSSVKLIQRSSMQSWQK